MINIGIIGYGYWGPNLARNFHKNSQCILKYICDTNENNLRKAQSLYPKAQCTNDSEELFDDPNLDVIVISTPVSSHYALAKKALLKRKHVFITKPMVLTCREATELINIANQKDLIGFVDHTFLYTPSIKYIKKIIDSGEIGELTYFDSVRVNLGLFQHDVNVIWDLAPHDLSILNYIINEEPISLFCSGVSHTGSKLIDVGFMTLHFENKMIANFHLNWLSPVKIRRIIIGGTKKMILYDEMNVTEKIKIFDKGIELKKSHDIHELLINYRVGDMYSPSLSESEALEDETNDFIQQIVTNTKPIVNSLEDGKEIVKILELSDKSLDSGEKIFFD
jgi:predicted dehydrogenase